MDVLKAHERANESIRELSTALTAWIDAIDDPDDNVDIRPRQIRTLPDADYGTVEGCDQVLRTLRDRIEVIEGVSGGPAVTAARDEALDDCRDLVDVVGHHRGLLVTADDDDDDD